MQPQTRSGYNTPQQNAAYPTLRTLQRNPSGKISYSPGNWKNYVAPDLTRRPQQSRSSYDSINRLSNQINNSQYHQLAQISLTKREQKQKKKQQMLKRIKSIQDRVMPLLQNDNHIKIQQQINWKTKIQQKIIKLQTIVDSMEKSLEIKLQKQILIFDQKMMEKYTQLQNRLSKNL